MKCHLFFFLAAFVVISSRCAHRNTSTTCYKGRLEVKAACSNYTIAVVSGDMDTSKIVSSWTDETTGKKYKNVFRLGNPCSFAASLNAGDEFYFELADDRKNCAVCLIYYPTPAKKLDIRVLDKPCP